MGMWVTDGVTYCARWWLKDGGVPGNNTMYFSTWLINVNLCLITFFLGIDACNGGTSLGVFVATLRVVKGFGDDMKGLLKSKIVILVRARRCSNSPKSFGTATLVK